MTWIEGGWVVCCRQHIVLALEILFIGPYIVHCTSQTLCIVHATDWISHALYILHWTSLLHCSCHWISLLFFVWVWWLKVKMLKMIVIVNNNNNNDSSHRVTTCRLASHTWPPVSPQELGRTWNVCYFSTLTDVC